MPPRRASTPAELLATRLVEDMAPLTGQVQRASDAAKFVGVRLGGVENVPMADEEASFAELQERIAKTVAFLKSVPREAIDGKEAATVTITTPRTSFEFTGIDYATQFALPNFYFHVTTAYAILRHKARADRQDGFPRREVMPKTPSFLAALAAALLLSAVAAVAGKPATPAELTFTPIAADTFVVQIDPNANVPRVEAAFRKQCPGTADCTILGWTDPAAAAHALPLSDAQVGGARRAL